MWKNDININFIRDNHFTELRDAEIFKERIGTLDGVANYIGPEGFFSKEYIYKNVLMLSDDEIAEMKKQIEAEAAAGEEMPDTDNETDEPEEEQPSDDDPDADEQPEEEPEES